MTDGESCIHFWEYAQSCGGESAAEYWKYAQNLGFVGLYKYSWRLIKNLNPFDIWKKVLHCCQFFMAEDGGHRPAKTHGHFCNVPLNLRF